MTSISLCAFLGTVVEFCISETKAPVDQDQISQLCLAVQRRSEEWATTQDSTESNKETDGPNGDGEGDDQDAVEEERTEEINLSGDSINGVRVKLLGHATSGSLVSAKRGDPCRLARLQPAGPRVRQHDEARVSQQAWPEA